MWLKFLKENSKVQPYRDIPIWYENLNSLPADGVPLGLRNVVDENIEIDEPLRDQNMEDVDFTNIPAENTSELNSTCRTFDALSCK